MVPQDAHTQRVRNNPTAMYGDASLPTGAAVLRDASGRRGFQEEERPYGELLHLLRALLYLAGKSAHRWLITSSPGSAT